MNATTINWTGSPVGRPANDTLTDRYVWAVLKSLPEGKRLDIDRELRASIADDVDARVESGDERAAAEGAVLLELGEPARLAASYLGRTLGLIGPDLYPAYTALLKLLYIVVLPIAAAAYFGTQLVIGTEPGALIGGTVGVLLSLVVHLGFWTTLVFAIAERGDTRLNRLPGLGDEPFDPDQLSSITTTTTGTSRSDLIGSLAALVLVPLGLIGQQFVPLGDAARPMPILTPALWSFWLPYLIVMVVLAAGFAVLLYRTGRWTWPLVALNAGLGVAVAIPFVLLLRSGELFNPVFLEAFGWDRALAAGSPASIATPIVVVGILIWSIGDSIWKTIKDDRVARS